MNIYELFITDRLAAYEALYRATETAGGIIFPKVQALYPDSSNYGVLSVWYDQNGYNDWVIGSNIPIGTITRSNHRLTSDRCSVLDRWATDRNMAMISALEADYIIYGSRPFIVSSQLAYETDDYQFAVAKHGGGIVCAKKRVVITFAANIPWKFKEIMCAHVAYLVGRSITSTRVRDIIRVSKNQLLKEHASEHFKFTA